MRFARDLVPSVLDLEFRPRAKQLFRIAVVAVHVLFTYLLLTPDPYATSDVFEALRDVEIEGFVIHCGVYVGLSVLLLLCVFGSRAELCAITYLSLHAFVTESIQAFVPGRTCDPWDTLANTLGIAIGLLAYHLLIGLPARAASFLREPEACAFDEA